MEHKHVGQEKVMKTKNQLIKYRHVETEIDSEIKDIALSKSKKRISPVEIDLSKISHISKDANFIDIPFFSFKKKKIQALNYIYDRKNDIKIEVRASIGQYIPSAFDFKVFNILLKYKAYFKNDKQFVISASQIFKELFPESKKISGRDLKRIRESIDRLRDTTYKIYGLYKIRGENKEYETKKRQSISILSEITEAENLFNSGDNLFAIAFSDIFIRNIANGYYYKVPVSVINKLSNPTAQLFYEIIRYDSYDVYTKTYKKAKVFSYDLVISKIPLTAKDNRDNKKTVDRIARECLSSGLINTFKPSYPNSNYFYIEFEIVKVENITLLPPINQNSVETEEILFSSDENSKDQIALPFETSLLDSKEKETQINELNAILNNMANKHGNSTPSSGAILEEYQAIMSALVVTGGELSKWEYFLSCVEYAHLNNKTGFFSFLGLVISEGYADKFIKDKMDEKHTKQMNLEKDTIVRLKKEQAETELQKKFDMKWNHYNTLPEAEKDKIVLQAKKNIPHIIKDTASTLYNEILKSEIVEIVEQYL